MDKITKQTQGLQLAIINHHTAGIDVGSMLMMVAYTDSAGKQCLLETDGFTQSIEHLALILKKERSNKCSNGGYRSLLDESL